MRLETERLILRPWDIEDAENLFAYAKDPDVGPAAGWLPHQSVEESRSVIQNVLNGPECYAICLKEDNKAIGSIELMLPGSNSRVSKADECELGYWIAKPFWGKGYVPEAARELIRRAFEDMSMSTIWCMYFDGNTKSKRVQEKCGFRYSHTVKDVEVALLKEVRVEHVNVLTKERWEKLQ